MSLRKRLAVAIACSSLLAGCAGDDPVEGGGIKVDSGGDEIGGQEAVPSTKTLQIALSEFGACMDLEIWMKTGIYHIYDVEVSGNGQDGQECQACHSDGTGGIMLGNDVFEAFEAHTQFPAVMRLVTGTVDEQGNFADLVPSKRYLEKGTQICPEGQNDCHPKYTMPETKMNAVIDFVDETLYRWKDGGCHDSYLPDADTGAEEG